MLDFLKANTIILINITKEKPERLRTPESEIGPKHRKRMVMSCKV